MGLARTRLVRGAGLGTVALESLGSFSPRCSRGVTRRIQRASRNQIGATLACGAAILLAPALHSLALVCLYFSVASSGFMAFLRYKPS
jgi:hypothetical protein